MLSIFSAVMEIDYLFLGLANLLTIISREQELCRCEMQECLGGEGMLRITKWDSVTEAQLGTHGEEKEGNWLTRGHQEYSC